MPVLLRRALETSSAIGLGIVLTIVGLGVVVYFFLRFYRMNAQMLAEACTRRAATAASGRKSADTQARKSVQIGATDAYLQKSQKADKAVAPEKLETESNTAQNKDVQTPQGKQEATSKSTLTAITPINAKEPQEPPENAKYPITQNLYVTAGNTTTDSLNCTRSNLHENDNRFAARRRSRSLNVKSSERYLRVPNQRRRPRSLERHRGNLRRQQRSQAQPGREHSKPYGHYYHKSGPNSSRTNPQFARPPPGTIHNERRWDETSSEYNSELEQKPETQNPEKAENAQEAPQKHVFGLPYPIRDFLKFSYHTSPKAPTEKLVKEDIGHNASHIHVRGRHGQRPSKENRKVSYTPVRYPGSSPLQHAPFSNLTSPYYYDIKKLRSLNRKLDAIYESLLALYGVEVPGLVPVQVFNLRETHGEDPNIDYAYEVAFWAALRINMVRLLRGLDGRHEYANSFEEDWGLQGISEKDVLDTAKCEIDETNLVHTLGELLLTKKKNRRKDISEQERVREYEWRQKDHNRREAGDRRAGKRFLTDEGIRERDYEDYSRDHDRYHGRSDRDKYRRDSYRHSHAPRLNGEYTNGPYDAPYPQSKLGSTSFGIIPLIIGLQKLLTL